MSWLRRSAQDRWRLPAVGGVLFAASFYSPLPLLDALALLPLLARLDAVESPRERFGAGLRFGLVTHAITLYFLWQLLRFTGLGLLLYVLLVVAFALKIAITTALLGWLRRGTGWGFGLLLPLCWLPVEWLEALGDLRMTADHVAHSLARHPFLIQFAEVTGHYGVGAFLLAVNGLLYDAFLGPTEPGRRRAAIALGLLLGVVLAYDAWAWSRPEASGDTLRVAVVQPNIPQTLKMEEGQSEREAAALDSGTRAAAQAGAQLVVWPESARPEPVYHWLERPETRAAPEVQRLADELDVPILAGVEYVRVRAPGDWDLYNAALLAQADGTLAESWAGKRYLVPFVEALPFRRLLGPLVEGRGGAWHWVAGGFDPAPGPVLLDVDGARLGLLVCYEELFPELSRALANAGADLQVVITNDAWWGRTAFQRYLADALSLRAIEVRTAFVRAANTGISGFVDRRGRYHDATALFEPAVIARDLRLGAGRTVYMRVGDVILLPIVVGLGVAIAVAVARARALKTA